MSLGVNKDYTHYFRRLNGRIATVTGASRSAGIGAEVCKKLAYEGADIFLHTGLTMIKKFGDRRSTAGVAGNAQGCSLFCAFESVIITIHRTSSVPAT